MKSVLIGNCLRLSIDSLADSYLTGELHVCKWCCSWQCVTILRWEKDECNNACFASISFRYRPEEDYRQERWETHVFSKAKRDYRVYRKLLLGYIIFKIYWKCVNGIDKYYSEFFQTCCGVILLNFPVFL